MKTKHIKNSMLLLAVLLAGLSASAQVSVREKSEKDAKGYRSTEESTTRDGKQVEKIQTEWGDKYYKMELMNDRVVSLSVDGEKIPQADWGKYSDVIAAI